MANRLEMTVNGLNGLSRMAIQVNSIFVNISVGRNPGDNFLPGDAESIAAALLAAAKVARENEAQNGAKQTAT